MYYKYTTSGRELLQFGTLNNRFHIRNILKFNCVAYF